MIKSIITFIYNLSINIKNALNYYNLNNSIKLHIKHLYIYFYDIY